MRFLVLIALATLLSATALDAQAASFCRGFSEGFKTKKGELAIVPICPIEPITPIGSTPYREGIRAGVRAGERAGGGNSGGPSAPDNQRDFCDGFATGWKSEKGNLAIVPICPIAPITPIGSTAYREGIKAGIDRARRSP